MVKHKEAKFGIFFHQNPEGYSVYCWGKLNGLNTTLGGRQQWNLFCLQILPWVVDHDSLRQDSCSRAGGAGGAGGACGAGGVGGAGEDGRAGGAGESRGAGVPRTWPGILNLQPYIRTPALPFYFSVFDP